MLFAAMDRRDSRDAMVQSLRRRLGKGGPERRITEVACSLLPGSHARVPFNRARRRPRPRPRAGDFPSVPGVEYNV